MPESHVEDLSSGGAEECLDRYRSLLAAMKDGFSLNEVICDPAGQPYDFRILDVNPAFESMFNLKKEMLVGRNYRQLAGVVDPILIERCGRVALSSEQDAFEIYSHKIERHFELKVYRPAPLQFAVLIRESREQMRMVENLRMCEAKSRALLDSIPDLMFHISEDGVILDCRAQIAGCLLNRESFIGGRLDELLPPDLAQKVFARMVVAHKSSSVTSFECRAPLGGSSVTMKLAWSTEKRAASSFSCGISAKRRGFKKPLLRANAASGRQWTTFPISLLSTTKSCASSMLTEWLWRSWDCLRMRFTAIAMKSYSVPRP